MFTVLIIVMAIIAINFALNLILGNQQDCFLCLGTNCKKCFVCFKATNCKNCFLCFSISNCKRCSFCEKCFNCKYCRNCILCKMCINCKNCYDVKNVVVARHVFVPNIASKVLFAMTLETVFSAMNVIPALIVEIVKSAIIV